MLKFFIYLKCLKGFPYYLKPVSSYIYDFNKIIGGWEGIYCNKLTPYIVIVKLFNLLGYIHAYIVKKYRQNCMSN